MGTGVGEAMLISAVTGAGTSAITGGDPLKGALLGAATGGVGAGIAGAGTSAATSAAAAPISTASASMVPQGLVPPVEMAGSLAPTAAAPTLTGGLPVSMPIDIPPVEMAGNLSPIASSPGLTGTLPPTTTGTPTFPTVNKVFAENPFLMPAGLGAAGAAMVPPKMLDEEEKYSGPLSRFRYDPGRYRPGMAGGGLADTAVARRYMKGGHLGSYSDGGRLLKGPGDGMSDDIPAKIGDKQPARLADGEFVVPADVVSGLGNGSTDAGARKLYMMMDKVRQARTGKKSQGKEINPSKYMPA